LLDDRRIRIPEAQKHTVPTDPNPDPQHWKKEPKKDKIYVLMTGILPLEDGRLLGFGTLHKDQRRNIYAAFLFQKIVLLTVKCNIFSF
jgi:hypothetical protein